MDGCWPWRNLPSNLFLTSDRNLQYQRNLRGRQIAVLMLSSNHWPTLKGHTALVQTALDRIQPSQFVRLEIPWRI